MKKFKNVVPNFDGMFINLIIPSLYYVLMKYIFIPSRPIIIYLMFIILIFSGPYARAPINQSNNFSTINYRSYMEMTNKRIRYIERSEFSPGLLYEYIDLVGAPNKPILMSQAILESRTFTSDIFIENNNLMGMKFPRVRETLATGSNRNHAMYDHWTCSVKDYIMWYDYMTRNKTYNNYLKFLSDIGYAEDPEYLNKLNNISNNLERYLTI